MQPKELQGDLPGVSQEHASLCNAQEIIFAPSLVGYVAHSNDGNPVRHVGTRLDDATADSPVAYEITEPLQGPRDFRRRAVLARTADLLDLAGAVSVPAGKRGTPGEEVRRQARARAARARR